MATSFGLSGRSMTPSDGEQASRRSRMPGIGSRAVAAAVFLASLVLQAAWMKGAVGHYDEGLALYGAQRVLRGDLPYRDFWTLYGPAQSYVLGGLFSWFGESVLTARVFDACCRGAITLFVHLLASRFASRSSALVAAAFACCVLIGAESYEAPVFAATACALASVVLAMRAIDTGRVDRWFAAGAMAGCALAFRTDFGSYALFACAWGWSRRWMRSRLPSADRGLLAIVAGFASIALPIALALVAAVPIADLYDDLVRIPSTVYVAARRLPFPDLEPYRLALALHAHRPLIVYLVYAPPIALALGVIALWRDRLRWNADRGAATIPFELVLVVEALFIVKGSVRVELLHMAPALAMAGVIIVALLDRHRLPAARTIGLSILLAAGLTAGLPPGGWHQTSERARHLARWLVNPSLHPLCADEPIERLRCFSIDADRRAVIDALLARTTARDTIYVGSVRHDKVLLNEAELYFLAARKAATKWYDVHPGIQTSIAIQREMVDAFTARPPTLVVLDDRWSAISEPNGSAISSGATLLDDWLRERYRPVLERGPYVVLAPRGSS